MKGISIKRFECYLLYLLSIHVAALFIFFIFRFTLFCSIDYQFPAEIKGDVLLQSGAFLRGLWFDNTIFVFLGDHGKMVGTPECEMPQSYNHIPLMIYGKDIKPGVYDGFGGQVDVSPTLLGLLNISYLQNNFGVNLLEEERPCMFFTADNLIGARDSVNMFIYSPDSQQEFKYKLEEGKLHAATGTDEEAFRNLKDYCFSMLQSTESLVKEHKTLDKVSVKK